MQSTTQAPSPAFAGGVFCTNDAQFHAVLTSYTSFLGSLDKKECFKFLITQIPVDSSIRNSEVLQNGSLVAKHINQEIIAIYASVFQRRCYN
jgi:hypothetical protein